MNFVTGSAGFIGSHLIERIGGEGYDNYSVPNAKIVNGNEKQDICDFPQLLNAMRSHEYIWHLAASGDIALGMKDTMQDFNNNTIGTRNVLEAMRKNGINRLVFSSSATFYGDQEGLMNEENKPKAISLYGASKIAGESYISAYHSLFGINAWVYRFGNVVGGRMGHGVIYDFIRKLMKDDKKLEIVGDGKQIRPFFLVEDCIDGMICGLRFPPDTYNLAPMDYITVDGIAYIVAEEMGIKDVKLVHSENRKYDVPVVKLDTAKIQRLGWIPSHTSEEAVRIATRRLLKDSL